MELLEVIARWFTISCFVTQQTYVQHLLKANAKEITTQIMGEKGHFYVCGDISMASDVSKTLQDILVKNAAMSRDQAKCFVDSMKDSGLYHEDIFGVTFKHEEITNKYRCASKK